MQETKETINGIVHFTQGWATILPMLEWLFSWEVVGVFVGILLTVALAVLTLDDYKLAKLFFLLAAADASAGVVMWGIKTESRIWQVPFAAFLLVGSIGALTVLAFWYVDGKKLAKETRTATTDAAKPSEEQPKSARPSPPFNITRSISLGNFFMIPSAADEKFTQVRMQLLPPVEDQFPDRYIINAVLLSFDNGGAVADHNISLKVLLATWFGPLWRFNLAHPQGR